MGRKYNDEDLAGGFSPEDVGPTVPPGTPRNPKVMEMLRANSDYIDAQYRRQQSFLRGHEDAHTE